MPSTIRTKKNPLYQKLIYMIINGPIHSECRSIGKGIKTYYTANILHLFDFININAPTLYEHFKKNYKTAYEYIYIKKIPQSTHDILKKLKDPSREKIKIIFLVKQSWKSR
jgi:hypothetical protein